LRLPVRNAPASAAAEGYAGARVNAGRLAWRDGAYCAVDLALTGLDPRRDEIVSFGAVGIDDGRIQMAGAVHGLVRPSGPLPERSVLVHGIRAEDVADAPPLPEAIEPLLALMAGRVLVVHAAWVERAFLGPALRRCGVRLRRPIVDTAALARLWLLERDGAAPRQLSLTQLAESLALPVHRPHHALGDALTTAQVFLALATHLDAQRPGETVRTLARAGDRVNAGLFYPRGRC
jgi:DNA polymerase III subunit epsilon